MGGGLDRYICSDVTDADVKKMRNCPRYDKSLCSTTMLKLVLHDVSVQHHKLGAGRRNCSLHLRTNDQAHSALGRSRKILERTYVRMYICSG